MTVIVCLYIDMNGLSALYADVFVLLEAGVTCSSVMAYTALPKVACSRPPEEHGTEYDHVRQ